MCSNGSAQVQPSISEVASRARIQREISKETYDVTAIGSGPSGLGAAVYAASEGLKTLLLDKLRPGGQAGSSSKIENYVDFPTGLSGRELALRSQLQAVKFGAEIPGTVASTMPLREWKPSFARTDLCTSSVEAIQRGREPCISPGSQMK